MKKNILILIFFSLSFISRIYISNLSTPKGDILVHQEWSKVLYHQGLTGSYFFNNWTYTPPTQPSLMMMAYSASRSIYENRNIFSAMHNLIKIPPAFILLGFQQYGQILTLKIWEFLATVIIAFIFYFYYSSKKSPNIGLIIFCLILFHPILFFTNSVWGQNDLLATIFIYIAFLILFTKQKIFSPVVFILGILFKPTIVVILPFFGILYLYLNTKKGNTLNKIKNIVIPLVLSLAIFYLSFLPFIPKNHNHLQYIRSIFDSRISNSSKGVELASVSAFNLYSLVFTIDKTYSAITPHFKLTYISWSFFVLLNIFFISKFFRSKKINFNHSLFTIFFISQGAFLLMTGMLERYFFPTFLSSLIIMALYWQKFGKLMLIQQLIWFLNLIYAYYHRDIEFISHFFKNNDFIFIRLLSLSSLFIFFLIAKKYLALLNSKNETLN
ncbi:MAG TPA: hypothetical protein PKZ29_00070 [Candidatus Woesebacteria bacterium]|jgi:Gpi18-like mannosyltransferase|nr:hypothetical protein [Candidatus Woesebacteria bacterium]